MTKRILSTLVSVLMTVTMYTPVHAVEEIPAGDEPETVETVQETETPTVAEEVTETEPEESVESAEDSEEASEIEEEPEESEEPAVIAEEPEEPAAEGEPEDAEELEEAGDPEPAEGEEPAADEEPEEESKEEPAAEEPEVFTVTPDPVTYNGVTVTVNYPSDAFGGKEVTLVVGEPGETEREALEALGGEFKAVDISFVDEEGNPVQPVEGKTVNVALIAEGMEASDEYRVAHVDAEGNVDFLDAETETSNEVTERVKTGETTRTVEVPAETETVVVEDYKTETYTDYEVRETTVEVPAETAYHYVRKSREVTRTESTGLLKRLLGMTGKNNNKTKTVTEYYYELEPYVVREAYTKTVTETVPVTRTRQVLVGTHTENRIIRDAYSYEETEDIFEDVTINDVETVFEAKSFSTYALVANSFSNNNEFVIYTGTTALAYNGNSLTTATVTVEDGTVVRSDSDNIVWTVTQQGIGINPTYRLSYTIGNTTYWLRNDNGTLTTTTSNNGPGSGGRDWTYDQTNKRLSQGNRYLSFNNGSFTMSSANGTSQAATVIVARVGVEFNFNYYNASRTATISASESGTVPSSWTNVSDIAKDIPGYTFLEARANNKDGDIIGQVNGSRYRQAGTNTESDLESIFFIYMRDYVAGEDIIPGLNGPITEKEVTQNDDGTFTIQLDITGVVNEVKHGANVVIVFDRTYSMSGTMSSADSTMRINAAISAVNTLVTTLNPGDPTIEGFYDIDFALVEFDRNAEVYDFGTNGITGHTQWTKSGTALTTRVSHYQNGANLAAQGNWAGTTGGTNWQAALQATAMVLENKPDADPTYVVFMTDGEPTFYIGATGVHNERSTTDPEYYTSVPYATAIVNADYHMYDIFCSASQTTLLQSLYTTSGADSYVMAETQAAVEAAFAAVAQDMIDAIGSSNYGVNDGVPELGSFDLDTVGGELQLSEARYYKKDANSSTFTAWNDAPVATPSSTGVLWDLSSVGTLAKDTVYRIEFEVWPSQAAYDMIANLNNGLCFYDYADYVASLPEGKEPLSEEAAVAAKLVLTADERSQIAEPVSAGAEYTLKTNTTLSATYKLYGKTITEDDIDFTADAMDLPVEPISVKKLWPENMLDEYGAADYRDPETGETYTAEEILLTMYRDGVRYMDILVKGSEGWKKDDIFVSNGFMTVTTENGQKVAHIKEPGHDYQLVEPPQFMYYWDLVSDIYHPMVINGTPTILIYDQDKTAADVDNVTYFSIGTNADNTPRIYKKQSDTSNNTLTGSNYRRSNLNLTKVITTGDPDALFTYTATVTDSYATDGLVWFSAWDPAANDFVYDLVTSGTKEIKDIPTGATIDEEAGTCTFINKDNKSETHPIAGDGKYYTGYFYVTNGTEVTITIKAGWNVRFLNLYHGSTYSFEETGMPGNFEFTSVAATTQWDFMHPSNADWYEIDEQNTDLITGTITEPNNNYTITYTNSPKPEFYIYHSGVAGDGNLETIQIPKEGATLSGNWNADRTYNLYAHTTTGTLYGGYYLDYAGKGDYKDDGVKGTTGVVYTGMNYEWSNPQTVIGTAMNPEAGVTYYIKEVPTYYLRNYHQITYVKSSGALTGLYLLSAIDDMNYNETGYVLTKTDSNEQDALVALTMTFKNTATNKSVTLKADALFYNLGITEAGEYLTYWNATGSDYYAVGSFTVLPYWITPDTITVTGVNTRTITISAMTRTGITKQDQQ